MDKDVPVSVWPEWELIEKIGEGSFGKVYKAKRTERGRSFYSAIKIISIPASKGELDSVRSEMNNEQSTREYFRNLVEDCIQEIYTMEHFCGNSHVVSFEDFKVVEYLDEIGWDISIRMEYLTSFMDYCTGKELTEKEVIKLGCDLAMALIYCRKLNIIHRDVKPENIFVSRFGDFKLGDFGIAREQAHTMSNMSKKGTYSYMAPEIYKGEKYDSSIDIYSLGIVLYKLMNQNRLPFLSLDKQLITYRDKENALTRRMSGETPPAPADAGEAFGAVILKACAYEEKERYQTPQELRQALERIRYEGTTPSKPKTTGERPVPESMPKFLQEGAAKQLARTSQLNTDAIRQARKNSGQMSVQPEKRSTGETAKNTAQNTAKVQSVIQSPQKSAPGKPVSRAVKPKVTSITDLEDSRDQDLREWEEPVTEYDGSVSERKKRKSFSRIIITAVILIVLIGGILVARNVLDSADGGKDTYVDTDDSDALNKGNFGTADSSDKSFAQAMETIREHATTIEDALDSYKREGTEGDRLRFYNGSGEIAKVLVYPDSSADGVYEEYFYWGEQMFYTYVWDGDEKQYFYYQDGFLIRWIDKDGKVHDKESDNDEYVELGDKYWSNSVMELQQ